jgi:hypothetical protein
VNSFTTFLFSIIFIFANSAHADFSFIGKELNVVKPISVRENEAEGTIPTENENDIACHLQVPEMPVPQTLEEKSVLKISSDIRVSLQKEDSIDDMLATLEMSHGLPKGFFADQLRGQYHSRAEFIALLKDNPLFHEKGRYAISFDIIASPSNSTYTIMCESNLIRTMSELLLAIDNGDSIKIRRNL